MDKPEIIFDIDGVLIDSIAVICSIYVNKYINYKDFKYPDYSKVNTWNFRDECPLFTDNEAEEIFDDDIFWKYLYFIPDTKEVLNELHKDFRLIACSIGSFNNIKNKIIYIDYNLPMIDEIIPIAKKDNLSVGKSIINMKNALLFVDDHQDNLYSSNCTNKVCFGDIKSWNKDWVGDRVNNMKELYKYIKERF